MPSPLQHILVPVDFSPASLNALRFATSLALPHAARITVFHAYRLEIIEPYMAIEMQQALQEQKEEMALERFRELVHDLQKEEKDTLHIDFRIALGLASEEVLVQCAGLQPDLVVMGMRGSSGSGLSLLGSVTTAVLQRAATPILVIPETVTYSGFKHIAYATHLEGEDLRVIDHMLPFAHEREAQFTCFHVHTAESADPSERMEMLHRAYAQEVKDQQISFSTLNADDVLGGIRRFVHEHHIDLLVMLTHSRSLLGKMLHKSYATRMARLTEVPLWIFTMGK